MQKQEVSTNTLVEFFGMSRSTLNGWLKSGVLGESFQSHNQGRELSFSFEDAVGVSIAKATLDVYKDYSTAKKAVNAFRLRWKDAEFPEFPVMGINVFKKEGVFISWAKIGFMESSKSEIHSTTVVFLDQILEDVKKLFAEGADMQPIASQEGPTGKVYTRTLVPRLIHLVKDGETVKYLRKVDDRLLIEESFQDDGKTYQPKHDLPIEYVSKGIVDILPNQRTLDARGVLDMVISFIKQHLELPYEQHYLILALWIFHTYLIEKFSVTPILYFFGTMATGKTRAGEVLGKLAFRCERMTSPSESYLFRSAQYFKNALVIDEIKLWGADGNKDVADLIKSRYKRGMSVPRINLNKAGESQVEYFDVFAPLVICTTETMPPIIESRCISFVMQQNANKEVEGDINEGDALMLREMLTVFRYFNYDKELPNVEGITRRRLNEITRPLLQICEMADPGRKDELIDFIKWLELQRADEDGESHEAQIVKCLVEESGLVQGRKFATAAVVDAMNQGIAEKLQYGSNYIAGCLRRLGFEKTRLTGGARGFKYDESLMEKLVQKYRIGLADSDD